MSYPKLITTHYMNVGGINEKLSRYATGQMEFLNMVNFDLETPGALQKGPGSTNYNSTIGASGMQDPVLDIYEFIKTNGYSSLVVATQNNLWTMTKGTSFNTVFNFFDASLAPQAHAKMLNFDDWLWVTNGQTMFKWDGVGLSPRSQGFPGSLGFHTSGHSSIGTSSGVFIQPRYCLAYINQRDAIGPVTPFQFIMFDNRTTGGASSILVNMNGITSLTTSIYGLKWFGLFRNDDGATLFGAISITTRRGDFAKDGIFYLLQTFSVGTTYTAFEDTYGSTSLVQQPITRTAADEYNYLRDEDNQIRASRFAEIHQYSMVLAGFSTAPSTFLVSELNEPENFLPESTFTVRKNDGDILTGVRSVNRQLLIFKERSFHRLVGDNPDNYELLEISTEYGALSDKAIVSVDGIVYFLDQKGIVRYDGSGWEIISDRMENTFRSMNLDAARDRATATHYANRQQIWFGIPTNGATLNSTTVIYDYMNDAWFKKDGYVANALGNAVAGLGTRQVFYGDHSGYVGYFSPSLFSYKGQAFTCLAQTRFDAPQGQNATAMFRRLWLDVEPVSGFTGAVTVTVLSDYSNTGITSTTIPQNSFQTRYEFGVPGKAVGFIFSHYHASLPCLINGWALGHRFLREV